MLVNQTFLCKNGSRRYKYLVVNEDRTKEETSTGKKYDETLICQMIDFLLDNGNIRYVTICFGNVSVSPWVYFLKDLWRSPIKSWQRLLI